MSLGPTKKGNSTALCMDGNMMNEHISSVPRLGRGLCQP